VQATSNIPYAYIRGAEMQLIAHCSDHILAGDDGIHQVLTSLRQRLAQNPAEALRIIDTLAAQFGVMLVDDEQAREVADQCGYRAAALRVAA
jgi:predicted nucleic acid-binding protein